MMCNIIVCFSCSYYYVVRMIMQALFSYNTTTSCHRVYSPPTPTYFIIPGVVFVLIFNNMG